jgi:membrane protease YdiL (CAAX protease family)
MLHFDLSGVHVVQAFAVGLYLGFIVEHTGSVLPAIACHVINNVLYTLQTAFRLTIQDRATNAVVALACALLFALCLAWLRRMAPPPQATA